MLRVENLQVTFKSKNSKVEAVRGVSFEISKGQTLAIVGESGCGKSVTCNAIMGLYSSRNTEISKKSLFFKSEDIATQIKSIRGQKISMIFQDPLTALNPTMSIGDQLVEGIKYHRNCTVRVALARARELLVLVGIENPDDRLKQYPHEFSGGMLQRIVIAMALMCEPELLIADEPTTALDVTIQLKILRLLKDLQNWLGMGLLVVTHDLGVVAAIADNMLVMYAGQVVESGLVSDVLKNPEHPYTKALLESMPSITTSIDELHAIDGQPPDLSNPPRGCAFFDRCRMAMKVCLSNEPPCFRLGNNLVKCWLKDERVRCNVV